MHYDPYESAASKKRRIISNAAIVVILVAMLTGIVFLLLPNGKQKKYDFETLQTKEISASDVNDGESEFETLIRALSDSNQISVGDSFTEKYPTCYSMLSMDGKAYENSHAEYSDEVENKCDVPYVEVGGGYITIAQSVVSTEKDCRDLLIVSYEANVTQTDNSVSIRLGEYNCYTVRYNTRNPSVPLKLLVGEQNAVLDLYKIKFSVSGENPLSAQYELTLNHAFDETRTKENTYHHLIFDPINESYGSADIITNDNTTDIIVKQDKNALTKNENQLAYELKLHDSNVIKLIDNVNISFKFEGKCENLKITFN